MTKWDWVALVGIVPASLAFQMNGIILGWLTYTISFIAFVDATPRQCFRRAVIAGAGAGIINFGWMLAAGDRFTGSGMLLSVGIVALLSCFLALYLGTIGWLYATLKRKHFYNVYSPWNFVNAVILGCIFVMFDGFMIYVADSFALILYVSYITVASDFYAIQPASVFGPLVISFFVIFINGVLAHIIYYRTWKLLYLPVLTLGLYYAWGVSILKFYEGSVIREKSFSAAIIAENVDPEFKWNDMNGNALVKQLFKLTNEAINKNAKLIVWSETVIPWNFQPDDPFMIELSRITSPKGITNLVGMNTDYNGRTYYNSIYCLLPEYQLGGRYDKRLALSFLEKPFMGLVLPFYNDHGFQVKEGESDLPLATPVGNAGVLLCNESTIPRLSNKSVKLGAQFLVNPGNDGWFANTYLAKQHYYHARLRAVETRRDVIVNNNSGFVGLIKASGKIEKMERRSEGFVSLVHVTPSDYASFGIRNPKLFMVFAFFLLLASVFFGGRFS
ncbi:apolipoprotein N-acyltransferase [Dyadobacter sp. CY312]|uniref:apolipoprotein N-acyltransferase n=1 Tax=Dyadobacter sp. CY312 TaxID=2907303 RepID=UPI001F28A2F6|nr:apolipoprotein N-acyltransferase [Dyadobacter sp. CY312]MCE7044573.1 apolipoprotein N-acyltransferase [Dyadobacter sp. CY312]